MCLRFDTFCGASLRSVAIFTAWYSVLITITLYVLSGIYLFESITYPSRGLYEGYDDSTAPTAYGSVYLGMAGLWTCCSAALILGVYWESHCLIAAWLALQIVSLGMASCNVIVELAINLNYMSLVAIPFVVIGILQLLLMISFFMELIEAKQTSKMHTPNTVNYY